MIPFRQYLGSGERLLWTGEPARGLRFASTDLVTIPFSIFWTGFSVFWMGAAYLMGAPLSFVLFGTPFVLVGLYLLVGRFLADAWRRGRTTYGLTSERIIVVVGGTVKSYPLETLPPFELEQRPDGTGSVLFKMPALTPSGGERQTLSFTPVAPSFEGVRDPKKVYDLLVAARRERLGIPERFAGGGGEEWPPR
ncbi:MAG TPA: hypothetical protein VHG91_16560 [Longimicrobium sp.]|nr:hypothetical protein [Longimicrobium sp.]